MENYIFEKHDDLKKIRKFSLQPALWTTSK